MTLNKIDLISTEYLVKVKDLVDMLLNKLYPWDFRIISISAIRGINIDKLKEVIYHYLRKEESKDICAKIRS